MERFAPLRRFWTRHRRLFWALHSTWALATGAAVLVAARERYELLPWVGVFLVLTWMSTLYFGRRIPEQTGAVDLGAEATSYLTRIMYQETLFFLIPFYAYSTVVGSVNVAFPLILGSLAILSCLDLVFDRWLRRSPAFRLLYFSMVAFAAINLLLPMLVPIGPGIATRVAAVAAVAGSIPLALGGRGGGWRGRWRVVPAAVGLILVALGMPRLIPPVPLRVERAVFASSIDRNTLAVDGALPAVTSVSELDGGLYVLFEVFAPGVVPTEVRLEWRRDGVPLKSSREVRIVAHEAGFRIWDAWRPPDAPIAPGRYEVDIVAGKDRLFGRASVVVHPSATLAGG